MQILRRHYKQNVAGDLTPFCTVKLRDILYTQNFLFNTQITLKRCTVFRGTANIFRVTLSSFICRISCLANDDKEVATHSARSVANKSFYKSAIDKSSHSVLNDLCNNSRPAHPHFWPLLINIPCNDSFIRNWLERTFCRRE